MHKQHGFLVIVAALLIVVIGFLGIAITYMSVGSSTGVTNLSQSTKALYLAESGFEQAIHLLLTPTISNRITCSGLSISNSLGEGAYAVTSSGPIYSSSSTTLSSSINASTTTIPVGSTSAYSATGRIMVDQESMNYSSTNGTNFIGVTRGVGGSLASAHASGAGVGQFQCNLSSQGGVPSLNPPSTTFGGKSSLSEAVQLEDGWVAGDNISASVWNLAHWNAPNEKQWTQQAISGGSTQDLTSVSIVSNVDVWMVGDKATALHFNGNSWSLVNTGIAGGDNLTSVSAVSSQEVWACADQGKVYKWTPGTNWTSPSNPGNNPNSISMVDASGSGVATTGWVVGAKKTAYFYNGSAWASANSGINVDLFGVSTLSSTDAWAVGKAAIYQWNGASWSGSSPTSATLNSVSMIKSGASDIGWAVGTGSTALYYNGSSWALKNTGLAASLTLNGVVTVNSNEAWTVSSTGLIYEWNGTTWTLIATLSTGLNGIDVTHHNNQPFSAWQENFA